MAEDISAANITEEEILAAIDEVEKAEGIEMSDEEREAVAAAIGSGTTLDADEVRETIENVVETPIAEESVETPVLGNGSDAAVTEESVDAATVENDTVVVNELNDTIEVPVVNEGTEETTNDLAIGDVVTLAPEITDAINGYDPSDVYRIESIDSDFAKLSRNGSDVPELSYIPMSKLTKSEFVVTATSDSSVENDTVEEEINETPVVEETVTTEEEITEPPVVEETVEEVVAVEKGSRPIRWARHFIDKVKSSVSVEEISRKLEASMERDKEKAEDLGELNLTGQVVSFRTSLLSAQLKLAKKASNRFKKARDFFKSNEFEDASFEETPVVEETVANEEQVVDAVAEPSLDNSTQELISSTNPYDMFKNLPEERKEAVLQDLVNGLFFQRQMIIEQQNLISDHETTITDQQQQLELAARTLSESNEALTQATNTVAELGQGQAVAEPVTSEEEITETPVVEETVASEEEITETPVVEETVDTSVTPLAYESRVEWDDSIIQQELEANKRGASKGKSYTKEEIKDALKAGKAKLKVKSTYTDEERQAEEARRRDENYTYDRERQAEVEAFWQNQAAYVGSDEYVQAASERATEFLEREAKRNAEIKALEEEKRATLIQQNNRQAALNRIKSNLIMDAYSDEQIMALDEIGSNENEQGFRR